MGLDSLDDLTKMVVDKFAPAVNRNLPPPIFPGSPLTDNELRVRWPSPRPSLPSPSPTTDTHSHFIRQTAILLKSVKDQRTLELTFPFPDEAPLYATKPGSFLSHLIGHEGPGSVLSLLKGRGWANGISAGAGNGAAGFEFFKIHVDLTTVGLGARLSLFLCFRSGVMR